MPHPPLRRRNEAHRLDQAGLPGCFALAVKVFKAMKGLHRRVPERGPLQQRLVNHQLQQLGQPVGAVLIKEVIGELLAQHLPEMEHEQGALRIREQQLVVPDVAELGAGIDQVLRVEVAVGEACLIAATKAAQNVERDRLVLWHQRAVVDRQIKQPGLVVSRAGVELEQRMAED